MSCNCKLGRGWHPVPRWIVRFHQLAFLATVLQPVAGFADFQAKSAEEPSSPTRGEPSVRAETAPTPSAAKERADERTRMVAATIEHPRDGRQPVSGLEVLAAMRAVPRHVFVPDNVRKYAYADSPLPIGFGQTISQPYIVALMTQLLEVSPEQKVLEIGTGSGYQAAVLARLTNDVYTIEIVRPLHERAAAVLKAQGYADVRCKYADGYLGWPELAPFDAIIVTCAAGHLPPPLWEQLKPGGRIVIPIGGPNELQRLVLVTKTADGHRRSRTITSVRFVPLTRAPDSSE